MWHQAPNHAQLERKSPNITVDGWNLASPRSNHLLRMVSWNLNTMRFEGNWTSQSFSDNMTGCLGIGNSMSPVSSIFLGGRIVTSLDYPLSCGHGNRFCRGGNFRIPMWNPAGGFFKDVFAFCFCFFNLGFYCVLQKWFNQCWRILRYSYVFSPCPLDICERV